MSINCEICSCDEEIIKKASYTGVDEFVKVKNISFPNVPQAAKWSKESYFMPIFYKDIAERIYNFEVRPDDVWVVSFPKCGTTWTQEMVWQISNGIDFEGPKKADLSVRFPFLENGCILSRKVSIPDVISILDKQDSPRFIKTHLPAPLLPKQLWTVRPKIIYVARNPKDAAISFFYQYRNIHHSSIELKDFLELYISGHLINTPFHTHVFDFWNMRHEKNILFLTFEEMKKDNPAAIEKAAKFLEKSLTKQQVIDLADYLSFPKFSQNASVNHKDLVIRLQNKLQQKIPDSDFYFVRKGEVGSFRNEMPREFIEKFDIWTRAEVLKAELGPEINSILFPIK